MKVIYLSFIQLFLFTTFSVKAQFDSIASDSVIVDPIATDTVVATNTTVKDTTDETPRYDEYGDSLIKEVKNYSESDKSTVADFNKYIDTYDKIRTRNAELLIVHVKNSDENTIHFNYPLNSRLEKISKNEVSQILYSNGKRDIFFLPDSVPEEIIVEGIKEKVEKDWKQITVLEDEAEIDESYLFIQKIQSNYEADRINASTSFLEKNALIILRRRAASLGGTTLLVTNKEVARSYGELPKIKMYATVYSKEE